MSSGSKMVTMRDLAREAGVSQPTVSRALRGHSRVSKATRERILALAAKRGYRPDPTLSALMVYRSRRKPHGHHGKIAIVTMWTEENRSFMEDRNADLHLKVDGSRNRAKELGYETEVFALGPGPNEQRRLSRILQAQGVRGVILGPLPKGFPPLTDFQWNAFSAVALSHIDDPPLHYVAQDQRFEMAYEKLKEMGYCRIGFCSQRPPESNFRYMKLAIYLKCLFMDGISPESSPPLLYDGAKALHPVPWLKKYKFDAVLTSVVRDFQDKVKGTAYESPDRLGLAALSLSADFPGAAETTGVVENTLMVGAAAVDLLHQMICQSDRGVPENRQAIILEGKWNQGTTAIGKKAGRS